MNKTKSILFYLFWISWMFPFTGNAQNQLPKSSPEECIRISKEILQLFQNKEYLKIIPYFDATLAKKTDVTALEESWLEIQKMLGSYQNLLDLKTERYVSSTIVFCVCRFGDHVADMKVVFNGASQVTSLNFFPHRNIF